MDKHKYLVIKFEDLPHTEMDTIQIVPNQWIGDFNDNNSVVTHFPPIIEYPNVDEMAKNSKDPSPNWKMYSAILLEGTNSYKDAEKLLQVLRRSHRREQQRFESNNVTSEKRPFHPEADQVKRQKVNHVKTNEHENELSPKPSTSTGLLNVPIYSQQKPTNVLDSSRDLMFRHFLEGIDENEEKPPSRAASVASGDDNVDNNEEITISDEIKYMFDQLQKKQMELRDKMFDELNAMVLDLKENFVFFCRQLRNNSIMSAADCEIIEDGTPRERANSNPFDSKHTLRYLNPGENLTELLPKRGVYILHSKFNYSLRMSKDSTELARNLFDGIFDMNKARYLHFTQLDTNAKNTLVDFIEMYCENKGEKFDKQKVLSCMKNVFSKWRYRSKNV